MHAKKMRITFYYCIRFKSTIIFNRRKLFVKVLPHTGLLQDLSDGNNSGRPEGRPLSNAC